MPSENGYAKTFRGKKAIEKRGRSLNKNKEPGINYEEWFSH